MKSVSDQAMICRKTQTLFDRADRQSAGDDQALQLFPRCIFWKGALLFDGCPRSAPGANVSAFSAVDNASREALL